MEENEEFLIERESLVFEHHIIKKLKPTQLYYKKSGHVNCFIEMDYEEVVEDLEKRIMFMNQKTE